ncbi:hypothetical protein K504DRAFT_386189 [Pleomassaria siparia CBS 279.74]|uniref:Uncharacterized protein n=1 Tax=Pleomassaria siparia CBS 279.74 TaxID=1314801 RepID=A0A6G1K0Z5_9PLEO|nr:hypothetical protein K504DRAFT_386189 [Pleomassaria siparia CBS 279.74]
MSKRPPRQPLRRPAQPLSWVLANHSKSYLEVSQYASGFTFLNTLLTTGSSVSTPAKRYRAYLAPAAQLALASTLVVYPSVTTKAKLPDAIKGSDAAVRYLRNVSTTIDPMDATLKSAFAFGERSRRQGQRSPNTSPTAKAANNAERLLGLPAESQSLLHRAEDFWHVVGWAFNCSRAHKKRWDRWKVWLELMLDFLEADWQARVKVGNEEGEDERQILLDSLIWHYVASEEQTNRTSRTRMVRAIVAMATPESNKEFKEIWAGETLDLKPKEDDTTRAVPKVDIENGEWGDIGSDDEDVVMEDVTEDDPIEPPSPTGSSSSVECMEFESENAIDQLGGIDAINLRQRLIALLSQVASHLPSDFTDLGSFYDSSVADVFLRLPTSVFSLILSTSKLSDIYQAALNSNLLFPLVSATTPNYASVHPNQSHFEELILPIRAMTQSVEKNTKVSLIVEQLFMCMMGANLLQPTDGLRTAIQSGIAARNTRRGKKGNVEEEQPSKRLLEASAERLLGLLELLEIANAIQPQERRRKSTSALSSPPDVLTSPKESD